MTTGRLSLSYGQAFVAPDRRCHRSSISVSVPSAQQMRTRGACALISDSASRSALASDLCVRGFLADYYSTPEHWSVKDSVYRVMRALNAWCHGQTRQMLNGSYVSSLSALVLMGRDAHLFHVGDTLVFRLRGAEFEQLSRDHVTDLGGYRYPARALGMDAGVDIDYIQPGLKQGDIFLFTTQGVRGTLLPSDYVELIRHDASDLNAACERLAQAARERADEQGYRSDSFCFQLVRVDELPDAQPDAPSRVYGDLPIPPELSLGDRIDGLEVVEVLSRTAHSRVYQVRDIRTDRRCVLKAPSPELSNRNAYLEHFLLQQWVVERVHSPFVVKVIEPSRPRRYLYYLMRHVSGTTLKAWMEQHPQASVTQRLDLALQLGKALQTLHHRNLLHQQVHPENVLVDPHGQVVLVDFSACHLLRDTDGQRRSRLLAQQVGLNEHSAPEYALGDDVGRRSDQYALASTVYWMLTGELPYTVPSHRLRSHTDLEQLNYRSARIRNPEVSRELDEVLCRALDPQRSLRFRRLSEFLYGLRPNRQSTDEARPSSTWREPAGVWKLIAGVLLVLLIGSWWFLAPV